MTRRSNLFWRYLPAAALALLLAACGGPTEPPQVTAPDGAALLTDEDIDRAELDVTEGVEEVSGVELGEVPEGEEIDLTDLEEFSVQAVIPGASGIIAYIRHNPALENPWRLYLANQVTDAQILIYEGKREIESVAASLDGNILVFVMRRTINSASSFEVFRYTVSSAALNRLTDTPDHHESNVSVSASGRIIVWEGTNPATLRRAVFIREGTSERRLGAAVDQVQPSISADGNYIALARHLADGRYRVMLYNLVDSTYITIITSASRLEHPGPSNLGLKVAWLERNAGRDRVRVKNLITGVTTNAVNMTKPSPDAKLVDHPHLAADGRHIAYALLQSGTWRAFTKNLSTGRTVRVVAGSANIYAPYWQKGASQGTLNAGADHTCGLDTGGRAYCWGKNEEGQLGNGSNTNRDTPQPVSGGHTFNAIASGVNHTCALTIRGEAYCWGLNASGQLGNGESGLEANKNTPHPVSGNHTFSAIAGGGYHTCALTSSGKAYCWGSNSHGQLGNGSNLWSTTPVAVFGNRTFVAIVAGIYHTCALDDAGKAFCWGYNEWGQIGNGTNDNSNRPRAVSGSRTFTALGVGFHHACALNVSGRALCWGLNSDGQLGNGASGEGADRNTPVAVSGSHTFVSIDGSMNSTCALHASGRAYCWGYNGFGKLGDGTFDPISATPVAVVGDHTHTVVSPGRDHTCALNASGLAHCWGNGSSGQLGDGENTIKRTPVAVRDITFDP